VSLVNRVCSRAHMLNLPHLEYPSHQLLLIPMSIFVDRNRINRRYSVHLLVIPMYICASQSLFSHSYVVNE
jgi:hypothetical protein